MSDKTTTNDNPDGLRESGELPGGVLHNGERHRTFTLRLPTVADNISAIDEVGSHNGVAVNAAMLARQLVALGSLECKAINYQLVASMHPADFNALDAAAQALEKKRWAALAAESITSASSSPSCEPG